MYTSQLKKDSKLNSQASLLHIFEADVTGAFERVFLM